MLKNPAELRSRLEQEIYNYQMLRLPPKLPRPFDAAAPLPLLPRPDAVAQALRDTPFAAEIRDLAARIRRRDIPLLGTSLQVGREIRWRKDLLSGLETGTDYFRRVPYLDAARAGDHKVIWELNRHQHLVVLAQDWLLHRDKASLEELIAQLDSWMEQNPFQRGINWASALEVAFRALAWIWIFQCAGEAFPRKFRRRWLQMLYWHGCHLERNLSFYFSPNTHLLGEAVALHALGVLFAFPRSAQWTLLGDMVMRQEIRNQVHADGSHFEHSSYYHVYALDMFVFHGLLSSPDAAYRAIVAKMAEYLEALLGPARRLSFFGDDDGGRFFHPYGRHDEYGRASLATAHFWLNGKWPATAAAVDIAPQAAWWLGPRKDAAVVPPATPVSESRLFPDVGIAVLRAPGIHVLFDAGPFGTGRGGHSHSDTLSFTVWRNGEPLLVDAGTYRYVGDAAARDAFRGSAAHNTVRIDQLDQAMPVNPFAWNELPHVQLIEWSPSDTYDRIVAECRYRGFRHRRRLILLKREALLLVFDEIDGPPGDHLVEQFWHPADDQASARLVVPGGKRQEGWISPALHSRIPAPVLRMAKTGQLPCRLSAAMRLD